MKSYTDLEQSKTLSKILPLETADMSWVCNGLGKPFARTIPIKGDPEELCGCWSLAAMLGVLPKGYSLGRRTIGKYYVCMTHIKHNISEFDNPVDACVEMILKLHELKML